MKKVSSLFLVVLMILSALPIQTLAASWVADDSVYAAILGNYIGSDIGTNI